MEKVTDIFGSTIVLTGERWEHIVAKHPEVKPYKDRVSSVLSSPDLVKESRRDKDVLLYYKHFDDILGGKYLLIVVKLKDRSFIVTAYITDRIKEGKEVWKKS